MKSICLIFFSFCISIVSIAQDIPSDVFGTYENEKNEKFTFFNLASEEASSMGTPSYASFYYTFEVNGKELKGFGSYLASENTYSFYRGSSKELLGTGTCQESDLRVSFTGMEKSNLVKKGIPDYLKTNDAVTSAKPTTASSSKEENSGMKKIAKIDLGDGTQELFDLLSGASTFKGSNGSTIEMKLDPNLKSANQGDFHTCYYKMTLINSTSSEYVILYGSFRKHIDTEVANKTISDQSGCGYFFQESKEGWIISISKSGNECIGGNQFESALSSLFVKTI